MPAAAARNRDTPHTVTTTEYNAAYIKITNHIAVPASRYSLLMNLLKPSGNFTYDQV
jgi:hypothetical protein